MKTAFFVLVALIGSCCASSASNLVSESRLISGSNLMLVQAPPKDGAECRVYCFLRGGPVRPLGSGDPLDREMSVKLHTSVPGKPILSHEKSTFYLVEYSFREDGKGNIRYEVDSRTGFRTVDEHLTVNATANEPGKRIPLTFLADHHCQKGAEEAGRRIQKEMIKPFSVASNPESDPGEQLGDGVCDPLKPSKDGVRRIVEYAPNGRTFKFALTCHPLFVQLASSRPGVNPLGRPSESVFQFSPPGEVDSFSKVLNKFVEWEAVARSKKPQGTDGVFKKAIPVGGDEPRYEFNWESAGEIARLFDLKEKDRPPLTSFEVHGFLEVLKELPKAQEELKEILDRPRKEAEDFK